MLFIIPFKFFFIIPEFIHVIISFIELLVNDIFSSGVLLSFIGEAQ